MSFSGLRVLSFESRRAAEIELLIRKQDGDPFVAATVREKALEDNTDAFRLLNLLEGGVYQILILMTGVGLSFWRDVIAARFSLERADSALRQATLLARGPKSAAVLRASGITPDVTVPEPNTWREIVELLAERTERKLALQEYGRPNVAFVNALNALGASTDTFSLYRWELPDDLTNLRQGIQRLAHREVDAVLFTSSVQLDHLLLVAREQNLEAEIKAALQKDVAVASVGPIMSEALEEQGITPDIVPASPKMGPLVYAAADLSAAVLARKRGVAT